MRNQSRRAIDRSSLSIKLRHRSARSPRAKPSPRKNRMVSERLGKAARLLRWRTRWRCMRTNIPSRTRSVRGPSIRARSRSTSTARTLSPLGRTNTLSRCRSGCRKPAANASLITNPTASDVWRRRSGYWSRNAGTVSASASGSVHSRNRQNARPFLAKAATGATTGTPSCCS